MSGDVPLKTGIVYVCMYIIRCVERSTAVCVPLKSNWETLCGPLKGLEDGNVCLYIRTVENGCCLRLDFFEYILKITAFMVPYRMLTHMEIRNGNFIR